MLELSSKIFPTYLSLLVVASLLDVGSLVATDSLVVEGVSYSSALDVLATLHDHIVADCNTSQNLVACCHTSLLELVSKLNRQAQTCRQSCYTLRGVRGVTGNFVGVPGGLK